MPGLTHDIVERGPSEFECIVCGQTWRSQSRTRCPGVKVYPRYDYAPLTTKGQLAYNGYQSAEKALPSPAGCFVLPTLETYVMLYDPEQAVKKERRSPRRRLKITAITWPVSLSPLLTSSVWGDWNFLISHGFTRRHDEIAHMIRHLTAFTPDEIAHYAGKCIHLTIPPTITRHQSFRDNSINHHSLVSHTINAYETHKAGLCING